MPRGTARVFAYTFGGATIRVPDLHLPHQPSTVLHNHNAPARMVYKGYSEKAPQYHLFRCVQLSRPPRRVVELVPFDRRRFSDNSKAGRGGCSMRRCPGDAVMMSTKDHHAYCQMHSQRSQQERQPCPYTSIEMCHRKLRLEEGPYGTRCPTCATIG